MTDIKEIGKATQDQILNTISVGSDAVVEGVRNWAETAESITPDSFKLPAIPGLDKLPSASEATEVGFEFAQKILDAQKAFAASLVDAMSPVLGKKDDSE